MVIFLESVKIIMLEYLFGNDIDAFIIIGERKFNWAQENIFECILSIPLV